MKLTFEKERFYLKCSFAQNGLIENLDKRWSKAKRMWLVYPARINKNILKNLPIKEISDEAKYELERDIQKNNGAINHIYKTEPLEFQFPATEKLLSLPYCALFSPVGSGKTKICIDVLQSLYTSGRISRILIVGLVSIRENWREELIKHWKGDIPWDGICITGIESYSQGKLYDEMSGWVNDQTAMVVDESSKIKNDKAKRTEKIIKLGKKCAYRYIATGTSVLNGNIDLFAQFKFLHPDIIGIQTFVGFRNRYCVMGGFQGKKIIGYKNQEELMNNLRPYSFVIDKEQAMPFLPSQTFAPRICQPNPEQKRLIIRIKKEMISESSKGDVTLDNALTKMLRIAQISGGFTEDAEPIKGGNPKLELLKEVIEESPDEPIVIFCRFLPEIHMLLDYLPESIGIYGAVKPEERQRRVNDFQAGKYKYIICQYASGALGLNMYRARLCVFFSYDFSLEYWIQSIGRIARMQQKRPMTYIPLLMRGAVDSMTYRVLQGKEEVAEYIRDCLNTNKLEEIFE